jgi:L-ascorbate metabolism protein UlaG (beta-lactamase superfamily)
MPRALTVTEFPVLGSVFVFHGVPSDVLVAGLDGFGRVVELHEHVVVVRIQAFSPRIRVASAQSRQAIHVLFITGGGLLVFGGDAGQQAFP